MKNLYLFILLILSTNICLCNELKIANQYNNKDQIVRLNEHINNLDQKFTDLQQFDVKAFNTAATLSTKVNDNISNQITILGLIIAGIGIGLTFFGISIGKKVTDASDLAIKTKNEIEEFVKDKYTELYKKIIDQGTGEMVNKISINHHEVNNLFNLLAVRNITGDKNFTGLLKAYNNAYTEKDMDNDTFPHNMTKLLSLIYQYYPDKITSHLDLFCSEESIYFCRYIGFYLKEILTSIANYFRINQL